MRELDLTSLRLFVTVCDAAETGPLHTRTYRHDPLRVVMPINSVVEFIQQRSPKRAA